MSPKVKGLILGSLKSAASIAIGAVSGLVLADPTMFNLTSAAGIGHLAKVVGGTILVTELRYGWQWLTAWSAKNPAPPPAAS